MDSIEQALKGKAKVVRVNTRTFVGSGLGQVYMVQAVPTLLVFNGSGGVVYRQAGMPDPATIIEAVEALLSQ